MNREINTEDEDTLLLPSKGGTGRVYFSIDPDGEMYIGIDNTKNSHLALYITAQSTQKLKDWVSKVKV